MTESHLLKRAAAAAQVLVNDLDTTHLADHDAHHLQSVLRLREGEQVVITDGLGSWRLCQWHQRALKMDGPVIHETQPEPVIAVGFSLMKGDRPELVVQKLTELGVDVIAPLITDHTVVTWDQRKCMKNIERMRHIAKEAAMQSRRVWLPEVRDVSRLADLDLEQVALAQPGGAKLTLERMVVTGPEGGWSAAELDRASRIVDLGSTILRSETAAIAAGARLCAIQSQFQTSNPVEQGS